MVKSEDILAKDQCFFKTKDGTLARKGTIAAAIMNANFLDELLVQPPSSVRDDRLKAVVQDVHKVLTPMHALNLFQFFTPIEWLQEKPSLRQGRIFIAVLFLQRHPELVDKNIANKLQEIKSQTGLELRVEIEKLLRTCSTSSVGKF